MLAWALLFSGLDYWTDTFLVLRILWLDSWSLASKHPWGTCSPLLNAEDEQWNMRKLSFYNFTTVHYAYPGV